MLHQSASRLSLKVLIFVLLLVPMAGGSELTPLPFGDLGEGSPASFFHQLKAGDFSSGGINFQLTETLWRIRGGEEKILSFTPQKGGTLHFLHFTENAGDRLGSYTLLYEDGGREEIPLQNGISIQDWWKPGRMPFAAEAFQDTLGGVHEGRIVAFWRFSIVNPHPARPLTALIVNVQDPTVIVNILAVTLDAEEKESVDETPCWVVGMDEEAYMLALLNQQADSGDEAKFCARLAQLGSRKSIPTLALYLQKEDTAHSAAIALAAMPWEEAHEVLRQGLKESSDNAKAVILEALGGLNNTRDSALIVPCLQDDNTLVRESALMALGRISGREALDALWKEVDQTDPGEVPVIQEALLRALEKLAVSQRKEAHKGYDRFLKQWPDTAAAVAAWRGLLLTSGVAEKALLVEALTNEDDHAWRGALSALPLMTGKKKTTRSAAALLSQLDSIHAIQLMGALAARGDDAATDELLPFMDSDDESLALAALDALSVLADATIVPALVKRASLKDGAIADGALHFLMTMKDPKTAQTLVRCLNQGDAAETVVVAEVLGDRREVAVAPSLRSLLQDRNSTVRAAAARALSRVGVGTDAALLCERWQQAESSEEETVFFEALRFLGTEYFSDPAYTSALAEAWNKETISLRLKLIPLFGRLGDDASLAFLQEAVQEGSEEEKEAACKAFAQIRHPGALSPILDLLRGRVQAKERLPLFRNLVRLLSHEALSEKEGTDLLKEALEEAQSLQEKRVLLSALNSFSSLEALALAQASFATEGLEAESAVAWGSIALALLEDHGHVIATAFPDFYSAALEAKLSENALQGLHELRRRLNATATAGSAIRFEEILIDPLFRSEGIAMADINRDGLLDAVVGDYWYEAPEWTRREIRSPGSFEPLTEYSNSFAVFADDLDRDGWIDVIVVGFPGAPVYWYRNPGQEERHWAAFLLAVEACGETVLYEDLTGDGKRELVFAMNKRMTWLTPGQDVTAPWIAHPFTHQLEAFALFGHGVGVGDLNKDGRNDVVITGGWWEGPEMFTRPDWGFYPADLGPDCAHMVIYDVNDDGLPDVLSSSAHDYGIWWFEQQASAEGVPRFARHEIDRSCASTHALILEDMNHDGLADLVTGKRFYAHGKEDPGALEASLLCWYELSRDSNGTPSWQQHIIHEDSGVGTQFEVGDLDGDGLPDIAVSSKKGVRLFLQRRDSSQ